ncbi:hypothetical protein Aduo_002104 [Ancylostoma duodenale]
MASWFHAIIEDDSSGSRKVFGVIKEVYPSFRPEAFISDDCSVFWKAFLNVFPEAAAVSHLLLCAWHVARAVFAHLKKEFPSDHAATLKLMEHMNVLFIESNKPRWQRALKYFLGLLADFQLDKENQRISKAAEEFESYFRRKYLARREEWAPYSRIFAIMNTNMFDERYNKTIKYDYLNKSANSLIDYVVQELIDSVNDFYRSRLTADVRNLTDGKTRIARTIQRHTAAVKACEQNVPVIELLSSNKWKIPSTDSESSRFYFITNKPCTRKTGKFHDRSYCSLCGVCPHCVACSCPDRRKSGVACKHSHIWWMLHDEESPFPLNEELQESQEFWESSYDHVDDAPNDALSEVMDAISRCSLNSSRASTAEDLLKLEEPEVALKRILSLWQDETSLSLRRKLNLTGRPSNVEKQLRRESLNRKFTSMERRSATHHRKKQGVKMATTLYPKFIPDSDIHVCSICERVEPDGDDDMLWFQCDNSDCRVWVHLDCIEVRECTFCETGTY